MILKLARSFNTRFLLSIALATAFTLIPQAHAEQSALEARLQRRVNQLSAQLEATSAPSASLREELQGLMRDGVALLDVPFNELTYQGKLQNGNRALVALANAYTQKTKDPFMDNGPEGFLKLISEQNVFHPEKIEYIGLAARAYPHLGGSSGLQIANLVSRLLFEKAIETTPYESKHLDEALLLLNSAYPLADGRDGTKDYYQTLFLTLSSLNHEESLKALTASLRSQQAKDSEHFGWVEGFLSSLETSLEETLKEALYQKEEIDLALRSIHKMNSGCTKEETEEPEETAEALEPSENFLKDRQLGILKEELHSDNSHLRLRALRALAQFEASKVLEILEGGKLYKEFQDVFKLLDKESTLAIWIALIQKGSIMKEEAAQFLLGYGEKAAPIVPALVNTLKSPEADVRLRAVHILGQIGEKAAPAIPALIEALKDPDKDVRLRVAKTLSLFEEKAAPAIPALIKALKDPDPLLRVQVAWALGKFEEKAASAIPALIEALKDPNKDVRLRVAKTLSLFGERAITAVPALIEALKDSEREMRTLAARMVGDFGERADSAIPALIEALQDPDPNLRVQAVWALGKFGEKATPAIPALIEALKDPSGNVQGETAFTLGKIGEKAIPSLTIASRDSNESIRFRSIQALGLTGESAIPFLTKILKDSDPHLRNHAAKALGKTGENAVPVLIEALNDSNSLVKGSATFSLGQLGEKAAPAIPAFTQIIFQEGENYHNRRKAINALKKIGPNALPVLNVTYHTHPDPKIRIQAGEAISQILKNLKAAQ